MSVNVGSGNSPYDISSGQTDSSDIVLAGGAMFVLSGGVADGTAVSSGGTLTIDSGGIASGTVVDGGHVVVSADGTASDTVISGGRLELKSGATASGAIDFAGSGALRIDGTTMPPNTISGLAPGDTIDLAGVSFAHGGMAGVTSGNMLQAAVGGTTYDLQLDPAQDLSGDSFALSADGHGGTAVTVKHGLTINLIFDASVTTAPNAAAIERAYRAAANYYESLYSNPITINIDVGYGEVEGGPINPKFLAESKARNFIVTDYATVKAALTANATSPDQLAAVASLPATDPTSGGIFKMTRAEAKALGLLAPNDATTVDGYVGIKSGSDLTFDPNNRAVAGDHDAIGALEHEISEIMGRYGSLGVKFGANVYTPLDLFRYLAPGVRTLAFGPGSFSVDGQTLLTTYNDPINGDDAADWLNSTRGDSFGGGGFGVEGAVTPTDVREMNVIGYVLASRQVITVSAGQTSNGLLISSGITLDLLSGGTASGTHVSGGGVDNVFGTDLSATILTSGVHIVSSGGTASATTVSNGGEDYVSGATVSATINSGGFELILSGGTAGGVTVKGGGEQDVFGIATSTTVTNSGAQYVRGVASGTTVKSGGAQFDYGIADDTTVQSGGLLDVESGGIALGTRLHASGAVGEAVFSGGKTFSETIYFGGAEAVHSGAAVFDLTISGGVATVFGSASGATIDGTSAHAGTMKVSSGGIASGTTISGDGVLRVLFGGLASGATVSSGGALVDYGTASGTRVSSGGVAYDAGKATSMGLLGGTEVVFGSAVSTTVESGGTQDIASGGIAKSTRVLSGGIQYDDGGARGTTLLGGTQVVFARATSTTIDGGGIQEVVAGGTATSATVSSGGIQYDAGTASGTTLSGGTQVVFGSAVSATIDSGGTQDVVVGGSASDTTVSSGGIQYDAGAASDTTLSGGLQAVYGNAANTTVDSGGYEVVLSGGTVDDATISSGLLELQGGATAGSSTIDFAGGGTLKLDATGAYSFLVAGFAVPDLLDLSGVDFASATKQYVGNTSSGTLTVGDGTNSVSLLLLGDYTAASFNLSAEGGGATGTVVTDPPLANGPFLTAAPSH